MSTGLKDRPMSSGFLLDITLRRGFPSACCTRPMVKGRAVRVLLPWMEVSNLHDVDATAGDPPMIPLP